MSWEKRPVGSNSWAKEGVLRHPDGSPDIAAYGRLAHRKRDAAILSAVQDAAHGLRAMTAAIWRVLGRAGRIRSNAPLRG